MLIQHILVPLDFSPDADLALEYTIAPMSPAWSAKSITVLIATSPPEAIAL